MIRMCVFNRVLFLGSVLAFGGVQLAGCETAPTKETSGTVIGAALGGLLGSQFGGGHGQTASTIAGVVLGGAVGKAIGKHMDASDHKKMSQALDANPAGETSTWRNESTGTNYAITPSNSFERDGKQCRAFVQEAIVDGQPKKISGTACKRPADGAWEET
jgi:surface antigen